MIHRSDPRSVCLAIFCSVRKRFTKPIRAAKYNFNITSNAPGRQTQPKNKEAARKQAAKITIDRESQGSKNRGRDPHNNYRHYR